MYVSGPALGDVGFSLRRPKWVRKLRPSKWKPKDFAKAGLVALTAPVSLPWLAAGTVATGGKSPTKWKPRDIAKAGALLAAAATSPIWAPAAAGAAASAAGFAAANAGAAARLLMSTGRQAAGQALSRRALIERAGSLLEGGQHSGYDPNAPPLQRESHFGYNPNAPTSTQQDEAPPKSAGSLAPIIIGGAILLFFMSKRKGR